MLSTVSFDVKIPLFGVASGFSDFVVNLNSKVAMEQALLDVLPMYKPHFQAGWFHVLFTGFKQISRRRLRQDQPTANSPAQTHWHSHPGLRPSMHATGTTMNVQVSVTINAVAQMVDHDVTIAYDKLKSAISAAAADGSLQSRIRAQDIKTGDAALATVSTPLALTFSAATTSPWRTPPPSRWPTSRPTSRPSQKQQLRDPQSYSLAITIAGTLATVLVLVVALLLYHCACKARVESLLERHKCCARRVAPAEPEAWEKRHGKLQQQQPGGGAGGVARRLFGVGVGAGKSTVAPAPVLPRFSAAQARETCEGFEPIMPYRPVVDTGLSSSRLDPSQPLALALNLGLTGDDGGVMPSLSSARALAIKARVIRNIHLAEQIELQRRLPVGNTVILSSKAGTAATGNSGEALELLSKAAATSIQQ